LKASKQITQESDFALSRLKEICLNTFDGTTPSGSLRSGNEEKILCRISNVKPTPKNKAQPVITSYTKGLHTPANREYYTQDGLGKVPSHFCNTKTSSFQALPLKYHLRNKKRRRKG